VRDTKKNQTVRYIMNVTIVVLLVVLIYFGTRPPHVTVSENYIKISGLYGVHLRVNDIDHIELREALPRIKSRTNGMDLFGIAKRGIYSLEELGRTRLISFSTGGPFILMHAGNEWIVINFKNPNETEALFDELEAAVMR
jgi:hypothetical protein